MLFLLRELALLPPGVAHRVRRLPVRATCAIVVEKYVRPGQPRAGRAHSLGITTVEERS
jgi:hypothetical protein